MSDEARRAILARRARFVAAALASAGLAAGLTQCGGKTERDGGGSDAGSDVAPQPCLGMPQQDAEPRPCLEPPEPDAEPQPCLGMPLPDAEPQPCLDVEWDAGDDVSPQPCLSAPQDPDAGG